MNPDGAQIERTVLSWRRTLVSLTVVALLLARLAATHTSPPVTIWALAAIALVWAGSVALTRRRTRRIATPIGRTLPALVVLILLYCVTGTLLLVS
ncbi:hypothetical protein GCM10010399_31210 [Dactylosporangium fulvum]|uniref:DUF202 domain-containing protein n=1 Tax=Dactylosporangium fulvum TaxID=53359 RepID=A0ABY5W207_9ACTN|nr:DUF202 domain-containing protein [Dactylosporangium fulvum]UWP84033.1 DUF202 domain-containing protein [Dactylosporangium fulvum]